MACWTPTAILRVECGVLDLRKSGQRSSCKMSQDKSDRLSADMFARRSERMCQRESVKICQECQKRNVRVRLSEPCSQICQLKWG